MLVWRRWRCERKREFARAERRSGIGVGGPPVTCTKRIILHKAWIEHLGFAGDVLSEGLSGRGRGTAGQDPYSGRESAAGRNMGIAGVSVSAGVLADGTLLVGCMGGPGAGHASLRCCVGNIGRSCDEAHAESFLAQFSSGPPQPSLLGT